MKYEHITREEWAKFFSCYPMQTDLALNDKIHEHVEECPDCKELYTSAIAVHEAASDYVAAFGLAESQQMDEWAYQAVASFGEVSAPETRGGYVAVDIDYDGTQGLFDEASMIYRGDAEKYSMLIKENGALIQEEYEAFLIKMEKDTLTIETEAGLEGKVRASVRSYEGEINISFVGKTGTCTLPRDDIYQLKIHFE